MLLFRHIAEHLTPLTIMSSHSRSKPHSKSTSRPGPRRDGKTSPVSPQTGSTPIRWHEAQFEARRKPIYRPNDPWVQGANLLSLLIEPRNRGEKKTKPSPSSSSISSHQQTGCNLTSLGGSNAVQGTRVCHRPELIDRSLETMWLQPRSSSLGRWALALNSL